MEKPMSDQSMLWGHALAFWDAIGVRLMFAGAIAGGVALALSLVSSFVLWKVSGLAQADLSAKTTSAHEHSLALEKEIASAKLETEQLKAATAWREIKPDDAAKLVSTLSSHPGTVSFRFAGNDPEATLYALQIAKAFEHAKWTILSFTPTMFTGSFIFGVLIPGRETPAIKAVRAAFAVSNIGFSTENVSGGAVVFGSNKTSRSDLGAGADAVIVIGSKKPPLPAHAP